MVKYFFSSKQDLQRIICANYMNIYIKKTMDNKKPREINSHTTLRKT